MKSILEATIVAMGTLDTTGCLLADSEEAIILRRAVFAAQLAEKDAAIEYLTRRVAELEDELRRLGEAAITLSNDAYQQQLEYERRIAELTTALEAARAATPPPISPANLSAMKSHSRTSGLRTNEAGEWLCDDCHQWLPLSAYYTQPGKPDRPMGRLCNKCKRHRQQLRATYGSGDVQTCPACGALTNGAKGLASHRQRTGCPGVAPNTLEKVPAPPEESTPVQKVNTKTDMIIAPITGAARNGRHIVATLDPLENGIDWHCAVCGSDAFSESLSQPGVCIKCARQP